jgi:hypothetical protein
MSFANLKTLIKRGANTPNASKKKREIRTPPTDSRKARNGIITATVHSVPKVLRLII